MKILFLTQTYPRFEGDTAGPFIRDLALGLVGHGDEVTVLAPHAPDVPERWDDGGVSVETFRYAPERWELLGYSRSLAADERAKLGAAAVAPLYLFGARRALARRLAEGSFDLLHAHWIVPNALAARPSSAKIPLAIGLHGSDVFMAEKLAIRRSAGRALRSSVLLTGCSPELVDRICALGRRPREVHVIPYGVDTTLFEPGEDREGGWRERLGIPRGAPLLLSVGRMATKKGYQYLVPILGHLLEAHPEAHLVFAGEGDRLDEWRRECRELDRVHFPGIVYRQTLPDLYRSADAFVLPAVHDSAGNVDGLPNVILEAMASGLPVVASGISGIPLAVEHGRTGLLVDEADREALYSALDRLLSSAGERHEMGRRGREKAVAELTWSAVSGRYRAAYVAALAGTSGGPGTAS